MTKTDLKQCLTSIFHLIDDVMEIPFSIKERTYEIPGNYFKNSRGVNKIGFEIYAESRPGWSSGVGIIPWKGNKKFVICVENGEGEIDYLSKPIKGRTRTCCHVLAVITEIELMGLPYRKD